MLGAAALAALPEEKRARYLSLWRRKYGGESFRAFIARMQPHHPSPPHMRHVVEAIERARLAGPVKVCISLPPRHTKTVHIMNAVAWWLTQVPGDTCAYASYNQEQSESKSRVIRDIALQAGIVLKDDTASVSEWRTIQGGGLLAGKGLTGKGVQGVLFVDDIFRDLEDAASRTERDKKWEWFLSVTMTRLEGASVIVVGTRWHKDDVIGRLEEQDDRRAADGLPREWEFINVAALAEPGDPLGRAEGEPLWPGSPYTKAYLTALKRTLGEYIFSALYQGRPVPRGSTLFGKPTYYDPETFDITGKRIIIYADPAATKKTSADYSAILALAVEGSGPVMKGWILEVDREQRSVAKFMDDLRAFQARWGDAKAHVEAFGVARGIVDVLESVDPSAQVEGDTPPGDKFLRAQPVAAAWNDPDGGRVLVPIRAPWLKDFLSEVSDFTGVNDAHDDQCLAAGTMILLDRGEVPIEDVREGDRAWTRSGLRTVLASMATGTKNTVSVDLSNGRSFRATGNHPVFISDGTITTVDAISGGCILWGWNETSSSSWGSSSDGTRTQRRSLTEDISGLELLTPSKEFRHYIRRFGSIAGGLYRRVMSFITSTIIPSITRFQTSAHVNVLRLSPGRREEVFNLKIEGEHEYFASGVLMHNCDALSGAWNSVGPEPTYTRLRTKAPRRL